MKTAEAWKRSSEPHRIIASEEKRGGCGSWVIWGDARKDERMFMSDIVWVVYRIVVGKTEPVLARERLWDEWTDEWAGSVSSIVVLTSSRPGSERIDRVEATSSIR